MQNEIEIIEQDRTVVTTLGAIFFSMELSRAKWLVTSLAPGGEKMSRYVIEAGDIAGLLDRLRQIREKAHHQTGKVYPFVSIQESGLDGFWIHRILVSEGIESHVVDPASIATSRRRRRPKTDRLDGETLVRTLLAWKRGEPRVCAMVVPPTIEQEDRRRNSRERRALIADRVKLVNRIKGLLFSHGIRDFEPLKSDRRARFEELVTGDGRSLPPHLKAEALRMLDRIELILEQMKAVEAVRNTLVAGAPEDAAVPACAANLMTLRGIGPDFAEVIWSEGLYRHFDNRRQLAAYAGLAPSPWQSGTISRDQGVSKAGNPRLRTIMVQLSWFWLLHQRESALARWFHERVERNNGRGRKVAIIALARKLLIALWKYVRHGVIIEGAVFKAA
jgi:transposase